MSFFLFRTSYLVYKKNLVNFLNCAMRWTSMLCWCHVCCSCWRCCVTLGVVELETGVGTLPRIRLEDISNARENVWHIVRHDSSTPTPTGVTPRGITRSSKVVSEIFLTRLLSTKVAPLITYFHCLFLYLPGKQEHLSFDIVDI